MALDLLETMLRFNPSRRYTVQVRHATACGLFRISSSFCHTHAHSGSVALPVGAASHDVTIARRLVLASLRFYTLLRTASSTHVWGAFAHLSRCFRHCKMCGHFFLPSIPRRKYPLRDGTETDVPALSLLFRCAQQCLAHKYLEELHQDADEVRPTLVCIQQLIRVNC